MVSRVFKSSSAFMPTRARIVEKMNSRWPEMGPLTSGLTLKRAGRHGAIAYSSLTEDHGMKVAIPSVKTF